MKYNLVFDVGGTGIKATYAQVGGEVSTNILEFPSLSNESKEVIIGHFCDICSAVWNSIEDVTKELNKIAMAFPGPFDYEKGIPLIKGLKKYEAIYSLSLPEELSRCFGERNTEFVPEGFSNYQFIHDVESYSRGVLAQYGLGEGTRVLFFCIGTGAGSAFSIDGKITTDESEGVPKDGLFYYYPFRESMVEEYIAARGVTQMAKKHYGETMTPYDLFVKREQGEELAKEAFDEYGKDLLEVLEPRLEAFHANVLVLGGKVSKAQKYFEGPLKAYCDSKGIKIITETETSQMAHLGLHRG